MSERAVEVSSNKFKGTINIRTKINETRKNHITGKKYFLMQINVIFSQSCRSDK